MDNSSLRHRTLVNVGYNFAAYIWPLLFSFLITPLMVIRLGTAQYGLFIFITTVSGIVSLVSGGIDAALVRHFSVYAAKGEKESMRRLLGTTHSIFFAIALCGALIIIGGFLLGSKALPESFSFSRQELIIFFCIAALNFFLQTIARTYQNLPTALARFDITSLVSIISLTVTSLGNLLLVIAGFGIEALLLFQMCLGGVMMIVWINIGKRLVPESSYALLLDYKELRHCLRFGSLTSLNDFARTSLFSLDRLLIPLFGGVSALTYYTVPGNLAARIPATADNLSGVIFPTASKLQAKGEEEQLKSLYTRSSRLITLLSIAITVGIIGNADKIMRYWLNSDFAAHSTNILIVLALTNLILSLLSPISSLLMGIGKMRFNTILSFVMAGLNVAALLILLPRYGIMGAAWAYLISVLPIFFAVFMIEGKYLVLQARLRYYAKFLFQHGIVTALTFLIVFYLLNPLIMNLSSLAGVAAASVTLYLLLYAAFGFMEEEDRRDIGHFIKKVSAKVASRA